MGDDQGEQTYPLELQCCAVDGEFVSLLTDTGEMREDIKSNKAAKKKLEAAKKKETEKEVASRACAAELEALLPKLQGTVAKKAETRATQEAALEELLEKVKGETNVIREDLEAP